MINVGAQLVKTVRSPSSSVPPRFLVNNPDAKSVDMVFFRSSRACAKSLVDQMGAIGSSYHG